MVLQLIKKRGRMWLNRYRILPRKTTFYHIIPPLHILMNLINLVSDRNFFQFIKLNNLNLKLSHNLWLTPYDS